MNTNSVRTVAMLSLIAASGAFASDATYSPATGYGPRPNLPEPRSPLIPTVDIAPATGWSAGQRPAVAPGLAVSEFAGDFDHPRTLLVLPNGDVLVAETNAPKRPEEGKGIKGKAMQLFMKKAGAAVPSANRITLLRDADGDGQAELRTVFSEGLNSPFGMVLVGETLFVANTDAVVRFPYRSGATKLDAAPQKVADLPAGPLNHHWTKALAASRDGTKLYVGVGSNSNVAEHGMEKEENRAAILEVDVASGRTRVYAGGLRNPTALAIEPATGALWAAVNERDELGDDLVPDYITSVKEGAFYGWPYSYFGATVDKRVDPPRPDLVAKAIAPDYAMGAHTACLGLAFYHGRALPQKYAGGAFVGQHGSWNRKPPAGYKVVFVRFANGMPTGMPEDVLTGFLNGDGHALGRPVAVAIDRTGALLVADDVGNKVWRVTAAK